MHDAPTPRPTAFDTDVLRRFESLGDNCEFGLVQAGIGVDQIGFFRFNNTPLDALLHAVETGFRDFEDPQGLTLEVAVNNELIVYLPGYEFRYHTFYQNGAVDREALLARQRRHLSYLARKLRDDLMTGRKIFLRKEVAGATRADMERLLAALRSHGPNRLLWIGEGTGTPQHVGDGLVRGYVDAFSRYEDARSFSFDWYRTCRAALALFGTDAAPATSEIPAATRSFCTHASSGAALLEDAWVDGSRGVVTPDANRDAPAQVILPAAYCLIGPDERLPGAYFDPDAFNVFTALLPAPVKAVLLFRDSRDFALINSIAECVSPRVPRLRLPPDARIRVHRLLCPTDTLLNIHRI